MFFVEYTFYPKPEVSVMDFSDETTWFMSTLYKNGQITKDYSSPIQGKDRLQCYCVAIEEISLEDRIFNSYGHKFMNTIITMSLRNPEYRIIGAELVTDSVCNCKEPASYILYTQLSSREPVTCGDCNGIVPLYRLPKLAQDDDEYLSVLGWRLEYEACDRLFMHSNVGERFAYRQMSNPNSQLS